MLRYFKSLSPGRIALWCYLIWYLVTAYYHFDPSPAIWLNSLGITLVIGCALLLSVRGKATGNGDGWQIFRLFLLPFCVSSFSSLIKNKGFVLILPPTSRERLVTIGLCAMFVLLVNVLKLFARKEKLAVEIGAQSQ
jgi:hypothetical protein